MAIETGRTGGDPDMQAAELALGLLEGEERATALRRILADPAFARELDAWRERLSPLDDDVPGREPPAATWRGIERRLEKRSVDIAARWRAATAAMTAVAAALLAGILLRAPSTPLPPVARPTLVAQLASPSATALLAVYEDNGGGLIVRPAVVDARNLDPELWVIPQGGKPVPLGVIARDRPTRLQPGVRRALLVEHATLAVSLEPVGGSPTGQPTGPVVATGSVGSI